MPSTPTRIDQDLFATAKVAGSLHSRSAAQQIDHWARIGREFESAPSVTVDAVSRVLRGERAYDELTDDREQAVVRAGWREQLEQRIASIDLEPQLAEAGLPWVEADADGELVTRGVTPPFE